MTFSYKEIRLCLAIGKPVSIVKGYGVQARAGRSSQDGRRRAVVLRRSASSIERSASSIERPASSAQRPASSVQHRALRYGGKAPFVPHLFCAAARFHPTDYPFSEVPTHFAKVIHRAKLRVIPSGWNLLIGGK